MGTIRGYNFLFPWLYDMINDCLGSLGVSMPTITAKDETGRKIGDLLQDDSTLLTSILDFDDDDVEED